MSVVEFRRSNNLQFVCIYKLNHEKKCKGCFTSQRVDLSGKRKLNLNENLKIIPTMTCHFLGDGSFRAAAD